MGSSAIGYNLGRIFQRLIVRIYFTCYADYHDMRNPKHLNILKNVLSQEISKYNSV